jgi:hypothetical protein
VSPYSTIFIPIRTGPTAARCPLGPPHSAHLIGLGWGYGAKGSRRGTTPRRCAPEQKGRGRSWCHPRKQTTHVPRRHSDYVPPAGKEWALLGETLGAAGKSCPGSANDRRAGG